MYFKIDIKKIILHDLTLLPMGTIVPQSFVEMIYDFLLKLEPKWPYNECG
jgi:hypothetical protein